MESKSKSTVLTLAISILNSVLLVLFNLIYNNLVIRYFGSSINGLISTLNQFVSLFSIIEGGFTTAAVVATYEPMVRSDYSRLNSILHTTRKIYLQIGTAISCCVLVFGFIYILFIDSPLGYGKTYLLLLISTLSMAFSLCFLSKYSVLLQGANKEYIQVGLSLLSRTVSWGISIILILLDRGIIAVFSVNVLNVLVNILFVRRYEKKHFKMINYKGKYDKELIPGTGDIIFQKIANTIFTSTDLVLISTLISLSFASVYALYYQVFKAVLTLLSSITQAPFNSFGQLAKENNREKLEDYFNIYQYIVMIVSTVVLSVTASLIIPFVKVYTLEITDFNYVYPSLAILFFMQIYAQIINRPYGTILNATGNFRMQNFQCVIAVITNLLVSVAFIHWIGINSIILGSFVGTMIILVMNIYQAYSKVLKSNCFRVVKNIILNFILSILIIMINILIGITPTNYISLFLFAFIIGIVETLSIMLFNYIFDRKEMKGAMRFLEQRWKEYRIKKTIYN